MLLLPRRPRANTGQQATSRPQPPPVGGWNARDALDQMPPTDAVILENMFPRESDVVSRHGFVEHCDTGEGAISVFTLAEWKAGASRKLVAGCNGKLIDVTTATPSTLGSGFSANRWRWRAFNERLFLVNGTDAPQDYDGTTLSATAWTGSGLTITNLSDVCVFKERLIFVEKNTLNAWYAGLKAITGTLTKFPLQYTGSFGGVLKSVGTISIDGGDGADDIIAFFLSSGEVIVYQGSDPGADFSRVGTFFIGPPLNDVPLLQYGNDIVAVTKSAYTPITRTLPYGRTQGKELDLSNQISGAVADAIYSYKDNTGWQPIFYPAENKLIINVPRSTSSFDQHVMNTNTKRWCKFTGWNFPVFAIYNDDLYAGGTDGKIYQVDTGFVDGASAIVIDLQTAWSHFGLPSQEKNFTMARVIFGAVSDPMAVMSFGVDFEISVPTSAVSTASVDAGAVWDVAVWDVDTWGGSTQAIRGWQGINGHGYYGSMRLRASLNSQSIALKSGNIIFKPAGMT